jgi:hypothetical protein
MTLELDLNPSPGNVLKKAIQLTSGQTVTQDECVHLELNKKVHIWSLSDKNILVLLEQDKKFIGLSKKKGSYDAILSYYRKMAFSDSNTRTH